MENVQAFDKEAEMEDWQFKDLHDRLDSLESNDRRQDQAIARLQESVTTLRVDMGKIETSITGMASSINAHTTRLSEKFDELRAQWPMSATAIVSLGGIILGALLTAFFTIHG